MAYICKCASKLKKIHVIVFIELSINWRFDEFFEWYRIKNQTSIFWRQAKIAFEIMCVLILFYTFFNFLFFIKTSDWLNSIHFRFLHGKIRTKHHNRNGQLVGDGFLRFFAVFDFSLHFSWPCALPQKLDKTDADLQHSPL